MSSMIKKKGTLSFKPKAPQSRRQPGALPSAPSSTRQSIERQSQTPVPQARSSIASPPPQSLQAQITAHEAVPQQDAIHTEPTIQIADGGTIEDTIIEEIDNEAHVLEIEKGNTAGDQSTQGDASHQTVATEIDGVPQSINQDPRAETSTISSDYDTTQLFAIVLRDPEPTDGGIQELPNSPGPQEVDLSVLGAGEATLLSQLVPTAELNPDGSSGVIIPPVPEKKTKRPTKRRKKDDGTDIRPSIEVSLHKKPRRRISRRAQRLGDGEVEAPKKRKRREQTPEDAEEQEIDHTTVKMADLTKDLRIGKKFSRHAEIKQRQIQKKAKARLDKEHPELLIQPENDDQAAPIVQVVPPLEASNGPQMRIVNGQIVIDDASLVVDRHAIAAAAASDMEEVEEDDFTRIITSGTFMKRERNLMWDNDANEKFYNGLRMFGTDFEMVSKMFPDRNRRQIKLKFNKEEREYPRKIASALIGETIKMDLEEYKSHTGLEYEEVADIEAEHARLEEEHNEEQRRMQAEADETTRQKKAEIQARSSTNAQGAGTTSRAEPAVGTDSAKENEPGRSGTLEGGKASAASKSKKKAATKKRKRNPHSVRGGGEEVEVLGAI